MVTCFYFVFYRQLTANSMSLAVGEKFQFIVDVEEYNIILNQWTIKSKMPQPFAYFGPVVKNGQIYVVGGISGFRPSDEHNSLRVYSPNKDVWADIQHPMSTLKGKVNAVLTK